MAEIATVYRWNLSKGTGVLTRADGTPAWFHLSTMSPEDYMALRVGDLVDVEIEDVPQGEFTCRAISVRKHIDG
ncbi:hypothetical protein [Nocardia miyunensis]|uniref:hypothetical protein n=1 Tax=Nocardia miyunensis TaxID=282684 RepID=UPI000830DDC6|nr:hypothetical protein [Nocardia miyunensis]